MLRKTDYNAKNSNRENKVPGISGLTAISALTAAKNVPIKTSDVSNLDKKTDCNTKLKEIEKKVTHHNHDKYITTPEFNKFTAEIFAPRLAQTNLITKTDFNTKLIRLHRKNNSNKTKYLLVENELKELHTFDSSYFKTKIILKKIVHKII